MKDIIINGKTLDTILEEHNHWIKEDCENWELMKANLKNANLCGVNLKNANLCDANLEGANLRCANLYGAILRDANLEGVNLEGANLMCANLYHTNLEGANLRNAALNETCLMFADLSGANLCGANLRCANLCGANLEGAKGYLIEYRKGKILTENIIGYKKCKNDIIVKLEIPKGAIVFSINGNKCRTNKAKVLNIKNADRAFSKWKYFSYYVGDEITINNFNLEYNIECAKGIHFFMTEEEAINY